MEELDKMNIKGLSPIDSITTLEGVIEYVEDCKFLNINEIVCSDYRAYLININLEEYFEE